MKLLPYGRQSIDHDDIEEVVRVLKSDWLSQGPKVREFEEAFAAYCGSRYAVAVSSGTAALHLACLAANLSSGDEAITSPVTFLATANAILYAGARPVFADIQRETVNIDPECVLKKITKRTRAILPVHFAGLPADLPKLYAIARKKGLTMIEDGCHALGAEYLKTKIGACRYSDMTVFSFHPVKHITTGEGGCITTHHKKLYQKLLMLRNHGIFRADSLGKQFGPWYFEMRQLGFNYRLTDMQCALGISQLKKLDRFLERRRAIAAAYDQAFAAYENCVTRPKLEHPDRRHAWHLYLLRLNLNRLSLSRKAFCAILREKGVTGHVHYMPLYRHPYYRRTFKGNPKAWPESEKYFREGLSLPMYPRMSDEDVTHVIRTVQETLEDGKKSKRTPVRLRARNKKMTVCIAGASGLLGQAMSQRFAQDPNVQVLGVSTTPFSPSAYWLPLRGSYTHHVFDLAKTSTSFSGWIKKNKPDLLINCAALVDLGLCERNPALAETLNVKVADQLSRIAKIQHMDFIHFSTDQVFDGTARRAYREDDPVHPLHVYGKTKRQAEEKVLANHPGALVLRTNIVGFRDQPTKPPTFAEWISRALLEREPITLFTDFVTSAIHVADLAELVWQAYQKRLAGLWNFAAHDFSSKYEFGKALAQVLHADFSNVKMGSLAASTMYPARPPFVALDVSKAEHALGRQFPTVLDAIHRLGKDCTARTAEKVTHGV